MFSRGLVAYQDGRQGLHWLDDVVHAAAWIDQMPLGLQSPQCSRTAELRRATFFLVEWQYKIKVGIPKTVGIKGFKTNLLVSCICGSKHVQKRAKLILLL